MVGYLTQADLELYFILDFINALEPSLVTDYANLVAHHDRIKNLPEIKTYLSSPHNIGKTFLMKIWWGNLYLIFVHTKNVSFYTK